uniref:Crystallin, gamma S4 n=1 Tax=Scophthalmus maximus TaxID=52904 RepID=A0A8D3ALL7_SCOMX
FQIVFFEDRDFRGKFYDCKGDSPDLHGFIHRCNSVKVEAGWWVLYERDNFTGYQYVIGPGEYNEYRHWMGFNDCVRSCRIIKNVSRQRKRKRENTNTSLELTDNMKTVQEKWLRQEVQSCKVLAGSWVFFEHPNFCGRQYLLEKGEYRHHSEWGALKGNVETPSRSTNGIKPTISDSFEKLRHVFHHMF